MSTPMDRLMTTEQRLLQARAERAQTTELTATRSLRSRCAEVRHFADRLRSVEQDAAACGLFTTPGIHGLSYDVLLAVAADDNGSVLEHGDPKGDVPPFSSYVLDGVYLFARLPQPLEVIA